METNIRIFSTGALTADKQKKERRAYGAKSAGCMLIALLLSVIVCQSATAMGHSPDKRAVVLAGFGTTYPTAVAAIIDIRKKVQKAFPRVTVKIAFTSNIIREIWHKRQQDATFLEENRDVPKDILYVKGPLATIADLQDAGYRTVIVQPLHVYDGEEYTDLCSYIRGLNAITTVKKKYQPFEKLAIGRPALGRHGIVHDYHKDMEAAAKALAPDVALAEKNGAALVYVGHGNEYYSTGVYAEFQEVMRRLYPKARVFVGTVEGFPSKDDVVSAVTSDGIKKVLLKPLMIVAGDHANNDMAGDDADSWKNTFKRAGIRVQCDIHGLGENPAWNELYVQHIEDVAKDYHINL